MRTAAGGSHRFWCLIALGAGSILAPLSATAADQWPEISAKAAIMLDYNTGQVLFDRGADERRPPASLTKLMTAEVVFHELRQGTVSLDDEFRVSERAWREGGATADSSTMFLPVHSEASLGDLLCGLIVQSGNDAAIVIAEGIAGSIESFAERMNRRAAEIGLDDSHFENPHGLPDQDQWVTMRDLARLAAHLIREYPERYHLFSEEKFTFNDITQYNHNPLLDIGIGADGLKTGYTDEAGYALVGSAVQDGRRLIVALTGEPSQALRSEDARKLLLSGFEALGQADASASDEHAHSAVAQDGENKPQCDGTASQPIGD